jgi:CTP-dependent riboflavin kinase
MTEILHCTGQLRLSSEGTKRTSGQFAKLVHDNAETFRRHLGTDIYPGSLNVEIGDPLGLQYILDARLIAPAGIIRRAELRNMPRYIGQSAFWRAELHHGEVSLPVWVFRRRRSKVPAGVIELLSSARLRDVHGMQDRARITLTLYAGPAPAQPWQTGAHLL